jgi:phospholipid/cholesterol/gamma-HCH transport system substrate-binding protein
MQILRNEVRTGLLVILTIGLVVGVVLYLSSPGLFKPLRKFHVYFDDAAGIKPGAPVMLAGRRIGTVGKINSPVPWDKRPPGRPNYEAQVTVEVSADAKIYRETMVTMRTFGLLADLVVDFTNGNSNSGLAQPGDTFVGVRQPDLGEIGPQIIQKLDPTLKEATTTLIELRRSAQNFTQLTEKDSPLVTTLDGTLKNFESVAANLKPITSKGGSVDNSLVKLQDTLTDVQRIAKQLESGNNLEKSLVNLNVSTERLKGILGQLHEALDRLLPQFDGIVTDLNQLTGKLKTQPWRIVWPSTIKYPQEQLTDPVKVPRKRAASRNSR